MVDALVIDDNDIVKCEWCGKHMMGREAEQRLNDEQTAYFILCEFDGEFDTKEESDIMRGLIITAAIDPELSEIMQYPYV
jgi:hypothetical protein